MPRVGLTERRGRVGEFLFELASRRTFACVSGVQLRVVRLLVGEALLGFGDRLAMTHLRSFERHSGVTEFLFELASRVAVARERGGQLRQLRLLIGELLVGCGSPLGARTTEPDVGQSKCPA